MTTVIPCSSFHLLVGVHSTENPDRKGDRRHKTGLRITLAESRTLQSPVFRTVQFRIHWLIAIIFMENNRNFQDFRCLLGGPSTVRIQRLAWLGKTQGSRVHDRPKKEDYFPGLRRFVQIKEY